MFHCNNDIFNKSQRANLICGIHCDARDLFGTIAMATDLHNDTGTKASLKSIYALIGANIALNLHDNRASRIRIKRRK